MSKFKANEVSDLEIKVMVAGEILRLTWSVGEGWKGTPATNGQDTAKLVIAFLQNNVL